MSFRALHVPGDPLLMINVWDAGGAKMMHALGAKALATSSAAHAFTLGRPDGGTISRDEALAHAQDIAAATPLPVQGDFENGFGDSPEDCAETVRLAAEAGLAGICIEDIKDGWSDPYEYELSVDRIKAAASAARALPHDFMLTARADGMMTGGYDTNEAIRRLQGFEAAGADCLYAPLPPSMAELERIVRSVNAPFNALVSGKFAQHVTADFAARGVARLSVGSSFARMTHRLMHQAGQSMIADGNFTALGDAMPFAEINDFLKR